MNLVAESSIAKPRISIVTAVFNGAAGISRTIDSVLAQRNISAELLVIDGASTDGTQSIVSGYGPAVTRFVSEADSGVYDAMNKGVMLARGDFLLMMNCGDVFASDDALAAALSATRPGVEQVLFGAWERLGEDGSTTRCAPVLERIYFNHQAVLYSRSLHLRFGGYVSAPGFSTADYLFFCTALAAPDVWRGTVDKVLARVDIGGISAGLQTTSQKYAIDHLFGRAGRMRLLAILALHPAYHSIKRWGRVVR